MYKILLELQKLVKPRQPHLPQTNVSGSAYLYVLIFNVLETILKINKKYFEKSLQLSKKKVVYLYQQKR